MRDGLIASLLFAVFFGLYVHTAASHIAPYRDTGEMVVLAETLGVAHPPGYPLYALMLNMWKHFVPGNPAYRANVFSGFAAALAVILLFHVLRTWLDRLPALLTAAFFGFSTVFWELANVAEMYTLGALLVCLLLWAAFRVNSVLLTGFLFALALGVRMDLLLLAPLFLYWFWAQQKASQFPKGIALFCVGLSLFLYMMVRSLQSPLLDWGNPETLQTLFNSVSRKSYGSTLDLLSLSYKTGENLSVNLSLYGKHLLKIFSLPGLLLGLFGIYGLFQKDRRLGTFFVGGFSIAGPLFLFMANMPPNPHAVAIVEASYLLPDLFVVVLVGFGLQALASRPLVLKGAIAAVIIGLGTQLPQAYERTNKRDNFYMRDYLVNLFRSAPSRSAVVLHKDVQVFSTWAAQLADRKRMDLGVIPTGLSGSPWYWEMKKKWPTGLTPEVTLKSKEGWEQMAILADNRMVLAGYDVDVPALGVSPHGLLMQVAARQRIEAGYLLSDLFVYRGRYQYEKTPDFFSTDLIGDHAKAHHRQGLQAMNEGRYAEADWFFARALVIDPTMGRAAADRGYLAYMQNQFGTAREYQGQAVRLYEQTVEKAREYKSLPDLVSAVKGDLSSAHLNLGVSCEKDGDLEAARNHYLEAGNVFPNAQAHYNMAVTYWNKDWNKVQEHLEASLRVNPQFADAAKFLQVARAKAGK